MKRREALSAACDLVADAFPPVARREDGSWQHVVGVTVDELPCLQFSCIAIGRTREAEEIHLQIRIAGTSDETVPLFRDPPGQPKPLLAGAVLSRAGTSEYRWSREREDLRTEIERATRARWIAWRTEAAALFAAAPRAWADACDRVAALDDPLRWMAISAEKRAPLLSGLPLPVRDAWQGGHWTAAWIGLSPVLDRVVESAPAAVARISNAAAIVRACTGSPGHA